MPVRPAIILPDPLGQRGFIATQWWLKSVIDNEHWMAVATPQLRFKRYGSPVPGAGPIQHITLFGDTVLAKRNGHWFQAVENDLWRPVSVGYQHDPAHAVKYPWTKN